MSEMQIGYGLFPASDLAGPMVGQSVDQLLKDDRVAQRARAIGSTLAGPARAAEVDDAIRDIFGVSALQAPCVSSLRPGGPVATVTRQ
ncbi:MAG: hypothetical protein A2177_08420 [Spirochaetes bacterium RBG_13_68_11]|nr:MAG: hypothetical protein A2177_08420 [Spirochaetes bacterium RBG_13_68_11]